MTRSVLFASILLGTVSLAYGYVSAENTVLGAIILVLGIVWMYIQWRGSYRFSAAGMTLGMLASAGGLFVGAGSIWMFAGVTFSLIAWDLTDFINRLKSVSEISDVPSMERRHFSRLGILVVGATFLYAITVTVHMQIGLWWLILLALVIALGLVQLIWLFNPK